MKRISSDIKKGIKRLYEKGESGHILAKKFGIHFSTVYDSLKRDGVKIRSSQEAGILASSKGRIAKHHLCKSFRRMSSEKAYLLGVMAGDGYLHCTKNKSYQIGLQAVDKDFVFEFADCVRKVYGIRSSIKKIKSKRMNWNDKWLARICCKEIFNDILNYGTFNMRSWRIPPIIFDSSDEIKGSFLRGFFDAEGHVGVYSRRVVAASTNKYGLNDVAILLKNIGIKSRIHKNSTICENRSMCFNLRITGRQNIVKYGEKIGFFIQRKQTKLNEITKSYKLFMKPHEEVKKLLPKMLELRNKGMSYERIANKLEIGTATAWVYLNKKHSSRN